MITKTRLWNVISQEMKIKYRLEAITESVMKKIKELETNNVENTNKQGLVVVVKQLPILLVKDMKIKLSRLEEIVRGVVKEAAKQGKMQKLYKTSYNKMINITRGGGNKNTAPLTKKAAKAGKSGLGPY